ncbi:uncharacterized protein JCM10292_001464 [Rhodotorula paludigena]|uniref:uncharacterized protein n=1 Tax=Rhodotorula paludigena TaxID=86838 RepID=UPI00317714D9
MPEVCAAVDSFAASPRAVAKATTVSTGQSPAVGLERWRESEDEDNWGGSAVKAEKGKGKAVAPPPAEGETAKSAASPRAKRAVASESWDDDFLFQEEPPPPIPRRTSSKTKSHSHSRPTTPSHRHAASTSQLPSSPSASSRTPYARPPASPNLRPFAFGGPATLSLDSLASSIAGTSDPEPTMTLASCTATPRPRREPQQSHVAHAADASDRPPLSRQTTPRTRIPKRSSSPLRPPPSPSPHDAPSDSDCRCETPSLTEDSFNSLTTGEEIVTEAEDAPARALPSPLDTSFSARLKSISGSKKWRFGRSGSTVDLNTAATARQEPEIRIVDRHELSRARRSDSPRSHLPRPVSRPVNGRASKGTVGTTGSGSTSGGGSRVKHSSNTSVSTSSGASLADTRARRTSLHFAPFSFSPSSRRGSLASPTESVAPSWREYMGSTTEDDGGETTSAETSDFGDSFEGNERRRPVGGPSRTSRPADPASRPVSPVESILGGDRSRWNTSQVSFASNASAFALRRSAPKAPSGETFVAGAGADASQGKKRKLTKKRPASGLADETSEMLSQSALGLADDGTSERPLLAPSIFSTSSGGSSVPSSNRTVLTRARSQYHPTLPFAQDSEDEVERGTARAPRQRSATGPVSSSHLATPAKNEKGEVVELDKEWLGVVPFPPSPRPSTDQPEPVTPTRSTSRPTSRMLRKASGVQTKSHPPVTVRTQAEARSTKRSSGIGSAISNLLSRSTSVLPLGSKRAPSPAPSAKSVKSSKSGILRRPSSRLGRASGEQGGRETPQLPKSPSLSALQRGASVSLVVPHSTSSAIPPSASVPAFDKPTPAPRVSSASARPPPLPRSSSTFSFLTRKRGASRSTPKSSPPPPVKASTPTPPPPTPVIPVHKPPSFDDPPRPAPPRPSRRISKPAGSHVPVASPRGQRGQLNPEFRMPRPVSNVSTASSGGSDVTSASTIMPLESYRDALAKRNPQQERVPPVPPLPRNLARPLNAGHRPSVSLSSLMPLRPSSPRPQPFRSERTTPEPQFPLALSVDGDGDGPSEPEASVTRRNSLSDLRIPARITNAQKKIEEDLERVKQFAKAIEDLKTLQRQYNQLIQVFVEPSPPSPGLLSPDQPSSAALNKTAQAARRVELDFSSTWEQVQTLINLADGAPSQGGLKKTSPGTLASRRDRCVSLAPERESHRLSLRAASGSETETETSLARKGSVRAHQRRPSSSSFETDASVAVRQREMLRGVLAPPAKGASLPSRAPPAARPPLPRLDSGASTVRSPSKKAIPLGASHTVAPTSPRSAAQPLSPASARRVSRGGVFGIREFLLRLRSKATEELAASVGSATELLPPATLAPPSPARRSVSDPATRPQTPRTAVSRPSAPMSADFRSPAQPTSHSDSEEDWDASPPRTSLLEFDAVLEADMGSLAARRERTRSVIVPGGAGSGAAEGDKMVLTTEAMPHLLDKVREVREACEACIGLLKGLTV